MIARLLAATYACNSEMQALTMATGAERMVNTLNSEMPNTVRRTVVLMKLKEFPPSLGIPVLLTCRSSSEVAQVQAAIEHFVAKAHERQNIFLVVKAHDEILVRIEKFVRSFSLHR